MVEELAFFPGMNITTDIKQKKFKEVIRMFQRKFKIISMGKHAELINK
jgi:hypothetical protein